MAILFYFMHDLFHSILSTSRKLRWTKHIISNFLRISDTRITLHSKFLAEISLQESENITTLEKK